MKALKCKPSAQFAYNYIYSYSINVLSKCSNIYNFTSIIDLRRSSHRSSIFEGRHIDHRSSKVDTSIIDLRRSTHRTHRSSKVDTSIFESRHIDLRRSMAETSHRQPNITSTIRHRILSTTALHSIIPKIPYGIISDEVTHAHTCNYTADPYI